MNTFCLLTGRGNNTLVDKNILPVFGKPLITYGAKQVKTIINNDNLYISSDDNKILDAVSDLGFKPIKRPLDISGPDAKHIDAITHGLNHIREQQNTSVDILVVMLGNSATVKSEWIEEGIKKIIEDPTITSVVPAYIEQDHHPYRAKKLDRDGRLVPYFDFGEDFISTNRQELPNNYFLSHNFWILNVKSSIDTNDGFKPWTFLGNKCVPIVVEDSFDVHDMNDIERTKRWLLYNKMVNKDEVSE